VQGTASNKGWLAVSVNSAAWRPRLWPASHQPINVTIGAPPVSVREPVLVIQPSRAWFRLDLAALWRYRELLYFLIWRDIKVRYKQTAIGAAWTILQPLMTMLIFTVIFGHFAKMPSDGLPYPVFAYTALLPWTYFASALNRSSVSVVGEAHLISKVYFPRALLPLAGTVSGLVDFAAAFVLLMGMMIWYGILPTWGILALPLFVLLALATALAVGLWCSSLNVRYRDVGLTVPFLTQCWMYASPVVYPVSLVPENWRLFYSLNPMAGVIEGFRWALLGRQGPDYSVMTVSAGVVVILLVSGLAFFGRMESTFADVI
jgi:lipopolysaccharide transport system permease protein